MVKRKLDPMRIVEVESKRYLYRCDACGAEYPEAPVPLDKMGLAPAHDCPKASQPGTAALFEALER
jgi:hypothetical protein